MNNLILPEINPNFETKELTGGEEEYRALKTAVHQSDLYHMIKSPHAFLWNLKHKKPATEKMKLGVLAHKAILEGRDFLEEYIVEPVFSGMTKDGVFTTSANATSVKQAKAEWYANLSPNQKVVTQADYDTLGFMMESLVSHKFVQEVFKDGRPEVRGQWLDPANQIGCVFANDFLTNDLSTWIDLKTCASSRDHDFKKSVQKLRYDLQAAMYLTGTEKVFGRRPRLKVWIALENVAPFECRIHHVGEYFEKSGAYEFRECMIKLKHCLIENKWPQGQAAIEMLEPDGWFTGYYDPRLNEG